jgi:hypothetical protein
MSTKLADLQVTSLYTQLTSSCWAGLANHNGNVILGWYDSSLNATPPSTASVYSIGCVMLNIAADGVKVNTGTVAAPTWTALTIN